MTDRTLDAPSHNGKQPREPMAVLMTRAQDGDKASYARLLRECAAITDSIASTAGLTGLAKQQVIADTLSTIHSARHTYDASQSFSDWLNAIAKRHAALQSRRPRVKARAWRRPDRDVCRGASVLPYPKDVYARRYRILRRARRALKRAASNMIGWLWKRRDFGVPTYAGRGRESS